MEIFDSVKLENLDDYRERARCDSAHGVGKRDPFVLRNEVFTENNRSGTKGCK